MKPQPIDKGQHLLVAPHPAWEALKGGPRLACRGEVADIAVDPRRIGPIGLDRDDIEAVIDDQPLRDRGARPVEFRGAVRRLAEQHHAGIAEPIEEPAERLAVFRRRQWLAVAMQQLAEFGRFRFLLPFQQADVVRHGLPPSPPKLLFWELGAAAAVPPRATAR